MSTKRSYTAGHFMMTIDGSPSVLKDFDGGNIKGEVGQIKLASDNLDIKTITNLKFEPFTINVGMSMGKSLYEWIKASIEKQHIYKTGFIAAANYDYKAMSYRHFQDALITEITLPALDASNKETAFFTIKFDPVKIEYQDGDNADIKGEVNTKQKVWHNSNFRFRLGDLPCSRVSKIDSITLKQSVVEDPVGEQRINDKVPGKLEVPNLKVTFSAVDGAPWQKWFKDFCIDGNCGNDKELSGVIEFLSPNGKEVLGSLDLFQVGIFALTTAKSESGKDEVHKMTAELYVERMALNLNHV